MIFLILFRCVFGYAAVAHVWWHSSGACSLEHRLALDKLLISTNRGFALLQNSSQRRAGSDLICSSAMEMGWAALDNNQYLDAVVSFQRGFAWDYKLQPFENFNSEAILGIMHVGAAIPQQNISNIFSLVMQATLDEGWWSRDHKDSAQEKSRFENTRTIFNRVNELLFTQPDGYAMVALYLIVEALTLSPHEPIGYVLLLNIGSMIQLHGLNVAEVYKKFEVAYPTLRREARHLNLNLLANAERAPSYNSQTCQSQLTSQL